MRPANARASKKVRRPVRSGERAVHGGALGSRRVDPKPFREPAALRAWFEKHASSERELWIIFYKIGSGKKSVTYSEALDEALCVGWIDGIVKSIDDESYIRRWTPRKKGSYWSTVNIKKAEGLIAQRRMTPAGQAAFDARDAKAAARYSFENRPHDLPPDALAAMKRDKAAWTFWQEQPAGYKRMVAWFLVSAKQDATGERRLALLMKHSRAGERIPQFVSPGKPLKPAANKRKNAKVRKARAK